MTTNETKFTTKSPDDDGYYTKRERAQKINFAQIQEIIQRNVSKSVNKTYTQYTRDLLDTYTANPSTNLDNIREISRFLARVSMLYKNMIEYFSTMPLYTYNITPIQDFTKEYSPDKVIKDYQKVLQIFHSFKMSKELHNVISNTIRDGMYVGYMYNSETDGMFLMPLDIKYCRIYGKTPEGEWIVYMDTSYFDTGDNGIYVKGVNDDGVGVWDQIFVDSYNEYKSKGRDYQWFRLPPEKTLCMIASTDDEFSVPLPYYLPLFKSLLQLLDTESLVAAKTEIQNYKLILNKIPLLNGEDVDDFAVSLDLINSFQRVLEQIIPDGIGIGVTPCDTDVIDFEKSTSANDTDDLNKAMNNLFSNAGINRLIVSSGDSSNANGIKYSIANDLGKISVYLRRIESWLNYYIKMNIADGFYLEIFDETQYNRDDFVNQKKEGATLGTSKMDYLCSLGNTPYIAYNKLRFETLALDMQQFMTPLQTSYTQSGDTNSEGGAPEKDETELSPEGQATRDSGKNDDKGNK